MRAIRLGVDVGGTFTDCVVEWTDGSWTVSKSSTTRPQSDGVLNAAAKQSVVLAEVESFTHGTTVATNALIQRHGGPALLLVTQGFGDVLEIQRGNRARLYDLTYEKAEPVIPRSDVIEVSERVDSSGTEITPVDSYALHESLAPFYERGYRSIGVCLLFAYRDPRHEEFIESQIRKDFPEASVSLSSRVAPEWKEFERASTTAMNAYLVPVVAEYLGQLRGKVEGAGLRSDFLVMQSNGGVMTSAAAEKFPSRLVRSGPAAGARAGAMSAIQSGFSSAISFDMGGTSTDISLAEAGEVQTRHATQLEVGMPLLGGAVDVESIGSGGGSIARVDEYGRLQVGPESAGSAPGPACYGRGGEEPTFVDAAVVLGWLDPEHPLAGGELYVDPGLAERAVMRVCHKLNATVEEAAAGIVRVGLSRLSDGVHAASIGRGRDARQMALTAFGGAGPLVGSLVAGGLSMAAVCVPPHPGAHSAVGLLISDFRYDFAQTRVRLASSVTPAEARKAFAELDSEARAMLAKEGLDKPAVTLARSIEARYAGQTHTVEVRLSARSAFKPSDLIEAFHARHEELYSYALPGREVELVTWRVTAEQPRQVNAFNARLPAPPRSRPRSSPRRIPIRLDGEIVRAAVFARAELGPGDSIAGPAIVTQMDSSTLLVPGDRGEVDAFSNLVVFKQ